MSMTPREMEQVADVFTTGIEAIITAMRYFNDEMDQQIKNQRVKVFQKLAKDMFRFNEDYSVDSLKHISNARSSIITLSVDYYQATQSIYEWCIVAVPLLQCYLDGLEKVGQTFEEQKSILMKVLDDGVRKMTLCLRKLNDMFNKLDNASKEITLSLTQLNSDFRSGSPYYGAIIHNHNAEITTDRNGPYIGPFGVVHFKSTLPDYSDILMEKMNVVKASFNHMDKLIREHKESHTLVTANFEQKVGLAGTFKNDVEKSRVTNDASASPDLFSKLRGTTKKIVEDLINLCTSFQSTHDK